MSQVLLYVGDVCTIIALLFSCWQKGRKMFLSVWILSFVSVFSFRNCVSSYLLLLPLSYQKTNGDETHEKIDVHLGNKNIFDCN